MVSLFTKMEMKGNNWFFCLVKVGITEQKFWGFYAQKQTHLILRLLSLALLKKKFVFSFRFSSTGVLVVVDDDDDEKDGTDESDDSGGSGGSSSGSCSSIIFVIKFHPAT